MKPTTLLIALLAGLASALLFAGLALQSSAAVGLALAAPVPVAIAALGFGRAAGYVAAIAGPLFIYALTQKAPSALTLAAALSLPVAVVAHLALGRLSPGGESADGAELPAGPPALWFPVSRLLFVLTVASAAACVFLGWLLAYDPAAILPELVQALTQNAEGLDPAERVQLENAASLIVAIVPLIQPAILTLTLAICLYLGAFVARQSGRLARPRDDLPSATVLPTGALLIFALSLAGTFLEGGGGLVATVFAGAFGTAFAFVGLARLHRRTRGRPGRGIVLFITYTAIVLLTFPLLVFVIFGIVETWRVGDRSTAPGG